MSGDSESPRKELQQFVLRSQHRLDALLETIQELRNAATQSTDQAMPLEKSVRETRAGSQVNDQRDDESNHQSTSLSDLLSDTVRLPNKTISDAISVQSAVDNSVATDTRLEALKQRLAKQIGNA